jgi:hypothetical protein
MANDYGTNVILQHWKAHQDRATTVALNTSMTPSVVLTAEVIRAETVVSRQSCSSEPWSSGVPRLLRAS